MSDGILNKAYGARDAQSTRKLYDEWADSYEAEVRENGYATPCRCADALAGFIGDPHRPVLDFGCGTGLSGLALKLAGFTTIDGIDPSFEMLEEARAKNLYRNTQRIEPGIALSHTPGDYAAIAAIGVIGASAAPISVFDIVMDGLAANGQFVFSINDYALQDPANEAKMQSYLEQNRAILLFKEYGDHLPGIGLNSNVYVIEKS